MKVIHTKPVFVGGSLVPAGTPFEVVDGAKLEVGMKEVEGSSEQKPASKSAKASKPADAETKVAIGADEPDTLAAMTKATVSADKKADPAQG